MSLVPPYCYWTSRATRVTSRHSLNIGQIWINSSSPFLWILTIIHPPFWWALHNYKPRWVLHLLDIHIWLQWESGKSQHREAIPDTSSVPGLLMCAAQSHAHAHWVPGSSEQHRMSELERILNDHIECLNVGYEGTKVKVRVLASSRICANTMNLPGKTRKVR